MDEIVLAQQWQEDVAREILVEPVNTKNVSCSHAAALRKFIHNRAKYQHQMERWQRWEPSLIRALIWSFGTLVVLLGAMITVIIVGSGRSLLGDITVGGVTGAIAIFIGTYITGVTLKEQDIKNPAKRMRGFRDKYLPTIVQSGRGDQVMIGLQHINDADFYTQRTFTASDEQAALEYQVELEEIIKSVSIAKQEEFVQAINGRKPTALPTGQQIIPIAVGEQITLFGVPTGEPRSERTDELLTTIKDQRSPVNELVNP